MLPVSARALMHGKTALSDDGLPCAVCGQPTMANDTTLLGKVVSDNFTTWDRVSGDRSAPVCSGCQNLFSDFRWRSTAMLVVQGQAPAKLDAATFTDLLRAPPDVPVVSQFEF